MLKLPDDNGVTIQRSAEFVKNPLFFDRQTALVDGPTEGCSQETQESRYYLCRELTLVAASGSERPSSSNRPGDRVDFNTEGYLMECDHRVWKVSMKSHRISFGMAFQGYRNVVRHSEVTERYPPYSRLALERVPTVRGGWGSGRRTIALKFREIYENL